MSLPEAERRRNERRSKPSSDESDGDDRRLGVGIVAAVGLCSGLIDLAGGLAMVVSPLFVIGVPAAAIGAVKCWAAVDLYRLRPRGVGITALFFGAGAMFATGELLFALGSAGGVALPAATIAVDVGIVGYLLLLVDELD